IECDHLKKHCKDLEIHSQTELKDKIDKLALDLNEKWTKKLKTDCEKIRKEITQQKDDEKQQAIEDIQKQKQNELSLAQRQIHELEQQVKDLLRQADV
ncbi:unnamed protein product, partial [Adineta steineri]